MLFFFFYFRYDGRVITIWCESTHFCFVSLACGSAAAVTADVCVCVCTEKKVITELDVTPFPFYGVCVCFRVTIIWRPGEVAGMRKMCVCGGGQLCCSFVS